MAGKGQLAKGPGLRALTFYFNLKLFGSAATPSGGASDAQRITVEARWDEKAGLRRDAMRSQVIDALEAHEIKETGDEED
jgi:hypothetical protein